MTPEPRILALGPWSPDQVSAVWREQPWEPPADLEQRADDEIAALRRRGSPSHDGLAARLSRWTGRPAGLTLHLEPTRWALRLVDGAESRALTAMCVVRAGDGRWLAGRRAAWLASWPGRWALGAAGAVEVGENPAATLARELEEEWSLTPTAMTVSALLMLPSGIAALVGLATVAADAAPTPDDEHDEYAWWPADVDCWPAETDERLRRLARFVEDLPAAR